MLATRGAVYHTRETAGELGQFHRHCDCKVVPGFESDPGAELVEGWKPFDALARLRQVEAETGVKAGNDWKHNAIITESMKLRNPEWLYTGKKPNVGYVDDAVKAKKFSNSREREKHELELSTARKLNELGIETVFQDDEPKVNGRTIGLADTANGIEIKTVYKAKSENSISKHISNAKKKKDAISIVIDVSENESLTDEQAKSFVLSSLKRHKVGKAYVLLHDGTLKLLMA